MKLGFIGFGEAAFEMSVGLKENGLSDIKAYDIMHDDPIFGDKIKERVAKARVELVYSSEEVIRDSQILIVAVPGSKAFETASFILDDINDDIIYVDVTASTVEVKKNIWNLIKDKTSRFVDAAMLGPLPLHQHKVPIAASGTGTDEFIKLMEPYGMKIEKISDEAGDGTAIKLIRSIFTKGLASLLLEVVDISNKTGVTDVVIRSISQSIDEVSFEYTINRLLTSSSIHAERRAHELIGSIEMLNEFIVDPSMSVAAKEKLTWLSEKKLNEKFKGETPKSLKDILGYL